MGWNEYWGWVWKDAQVKGVIILAIIIGALLYLGIKKIFGRKS